MSVGLDTYIDEAIAIFTSDLWTTKNNSFLGRSYRLKQDNRIQPCIYDETTQNGKYREVFATKDYDSIVHFDVETNSDIIGTSQGTIDVNIFFAVNLSKIYGDTLRYVEQAKADIMDVLQYTSFDVESYVDQLPAYTDIYELTSDQEGKFNMQPFYVIRFQTTIMAALGACPTTPAVVNYTLNISHVGNGVTNPDTGIYSEAAGTVVRYTTTPDPGYELVNTTVNGTPTTDEWFDLTMDGGKTVITTFEAEIPFYTDATEYWTGSIIESGGNYYFEGSKGVANLLITDYDFNTDTFTWENGFPYRSEATISAPVGNQTLIDADVDNFFYTAGTPNEISIDSFMDLLDNSSYFYKISIIDNEQAISYIALYDTVKTGSDLEDCQTFYNGSVTKYASDYGFAPTASAAINTAAINTALSGGGYVFVDTLGTYDINATIYVPSNTTLAFIENSKIRKTGDETTYTQMIANNGNKTETTNTNIKILGKGIEFLVNGLDDFTTQDLYGIVSQIVLVNTSYSIIQGLKIPDLGTVQFGTGFNNLTYSVIRDTWIEGDKDGFHLNGFSNDLDFVNCTTRTLDNAAFVGGSAFEFNAYGIGDTYNINFKNFTNLYVNTQIDGGATIYMTSNSWLDWAFGNTYKFGDRCVNAGRVYIKSNDVGLEAASNPPIHSTGKATGVDGIQWRMLHNGVAYTENVNNVNFIGGTNTERRKFIQFANENDAFMRSTYPGSFGAAKMDNITVDNLTLNPDGGIRGNIMGIYGNVGEATIKNSIQDFELVIFDSYVMFYDVEDDNSNCDKLIIEGCEIDLTGATYKFIGITRTNANTTNLTVAALEIKDCVLNFAGTTNNYLIESNYVGQLTSILFDSNVFTLNTDNTTNLIYLGIFSDTIGTAINITSLDNVYTLKVDKSERMIFSYPNSQGKWNGTRDTYNNLNRFFWNSSGTTGNIVFNACVIDNPQALISNSEANVNVNLTAVDTTFNQPQFWLFFNNNAASFIVVDSTGSLGDVTEGKVQSGINITVTGDLP